MMYVAAIDDAGSIIQRWDSIRELSIKASTASVSVVEANVSRGLME
jgi:hypothetical protein